MKTFQEFILEALLIETAQEKYAKIRRQIKTLQSRGKPGDEEEALRLSIRAQQLARQIRLAAEGGATLQQMRDTPRTPSNPNSITGGGYAQVGTSQHSRIDPDTLKSQPNIAHPDDDEEARSSSVVAGRYSDTRKGTGMKATLRNRGTSRTGDTLG